MKQYNWSWWFVLSIIWLLSMFLISMVATPQELKQLGKNWLFVVGYIICILNLLACVYIGGMPSDE